MKVTYYSHSACLIETSKHKLLVDPFLSGNSFCNIDPDDVKCDYILLTHGHMDHVGDTEAIAKANNATVIANFELAGFLESKGLTVHPLHIGGGAQFPFGHVKLTIAFHGSSYPGEDGLPIYMGMPGGILLKADEQTLYHAGDTGLTMEFELLGRYNDIDLALLPIGDNFTMGIDDALIALDMLKPKAVIPVHYNTFPPIECDPQVFSDGALEKNVMCHVLGCGESVEI